MPHSRGIFKITAACALLGALAGVGLRHGAEHAATQTPVLHAPTQSAPGALPAAIARILSAGTASPRPVTLPVVAQPAPVPAAIRDVLPGLTRAVKDWRAFRPDKITVAPFVDLPIEFEVASVKEHLGRTVWTGRNALQGAFLASSATETEWFGILAIPEGATFEIAISGDTATVTEKIDDGVCGLPLTVPHRAFTRTVGAALGDVLTTTTADTPPQGAVAAGDVNVVDILFLFDAATLASVGSQFTFDTRMIANIEASNLAIQNSGVDNLQWRFVVSYQVPGYTATAKMEDDLNQITYATNPVGQFVREKSILHGTDDAVLYVGGTRDFAGIAWMPGRHAVVLWGTSFMTLAHEIGHNAGCNHDRVTAEATDGDGKYNYGYRFLINGRDTGTIMSYASSRVQYFSNPDVSYQGQPLGVPADQPKAANNARTLRESAAAMAGFRAPATAPVITSHPQSTSTPEGQSFTFSVTASGGSLSYQWTKAGVAIAGATKATYSKSGATASDADNYAVIVSNPAGTTTSNSATVTITAPLPATTAAASNAADAGGGGGGGGGGSTGGWFTAALGAWLLARRLRRTPA